MKYPKIDDTIQFWFGANDTAGSGGDGASAVFDVRLGGASSSGAPTLSGNCTLLTHANYPAGCYEVEIAVTVANGFAANGMYGVFSTLAIDSQNPTGFIGDFQVGPVEAVLADGVAHGGTPGSSTATLALVSETVSNPSGTAVTHQSTGGNGRGEYTVGHGDGEGRMIQGGATASTGADYVLALSSTAVRWEAANAGNCLDLIGGASANGYGIYIDTTGECIYAAVNTEGNCITLSSAGVGKHDINLAGSGDILGDLTGNVSGSVGTVNALAANSITAAATAADFLAEINAEMVDALAVDAYAEPGQGAPSATTTLAAKINYLYKAWRNLKTQTATQFALYADNGTTIDQKGTVGETGGTTTLGEIGSGP